MRRTDTLTIAGLVLATLPATLADPTDLRVTGSVCEGSMAPGFVLAESAGPPPCRKPVQRAIVRLTPESGDTGAITLTTTDANGRFTLGPITADDKNRYCLSAQQSGFLGVELCLPRSMLATLDKHPLQIDLTRMPESVGNAVATFRERADQTALPHSSASLDLVNPWQVGGRAFVDTIQPAYDHLELQDLDSHRITAQSLRGKVVLVFIWNLRCVWCRKELPAINALYAQHHTKGLEIIGISDDAQEASRFREFVAAKQLTWPQVLVESHEDPRIAAFHIVGEPSMLIVDRAGKVQLPINQANYVERVESMFAAKR